MFEFDQAKCPSEKHPDPNETKPLFLKPLQAVWDHFPEWNQSNTLLVDDTPAKARDNPPHLLFSPTEWTVLSSNGENGLAPGGQVYEFLDGLRKSSGTVAEYVACISNADRKLE